MDKGREKVGNPLTRSWKVCGRKTGEGWKLVKRRGGGLEGGNERDAKEL